MHYYVLPSEWNTDDDAGFSVWDLLDAVGAIDLRSLPHMSVADGISQGVAFGAFQAPIINPEAIHLGDSLAGLRNKSAVETELGLGVGELVATNVRDVLWELFTQHADATGAARWKPIIPTRGRKMELHIGGHSLLRSETYIEAMHPLVLDVERENYRQVREDTINRDTLGIRNRDPQFHRQYLQALVEKYGLPFERFIPSGLPRETPITHGTTVTDNFTRANESLDASANWAEVSGDINVVANEVAWVATNNASARYEVDLASSDHYGELRGVSVPNSNSSRYGVGLARFSSSANTYYGYLTRNSGSNSAIYKRVTGTHTNLQFLAAHSSAGTTRTEANGSTITGFFDSTDDGNVTDTAITGNVRAGLAIRSNGDSGDDFEAADLAAAVGIRNPFGGPMVLRNPLGA